jgi:hypothetical protein
MNSGNEQIPQNQPVPCLDSRRGKGKRQRLKREKALRRAAAERGEPAFVKQLKSLKQILERI